MHPALTAYLEREKAATATPQGADHKAILADVAQEHGMGATDLRDLIKKHTVMEPN